MKANPYAYVWFTVSNGVLPRAKLHCCAAMIRTRQVDKSFIFNISAEEKITVSFVFAR